MYHTHKTAGLVLAKHPAKEANSFVIVFTRELGLIKASAQGAQKITSKLRYGLQRFSFSTFSFIYGKQSWKITNAVPIENLYYTLNTNSQKTHIMGNICNLLQRLLTGEEKNEELFDLIINGFLFLKNYNTNKTGLAHFEFLFVLRILYNLGYISGSGDLELLARGQEWTEDYVRSLYEHRKEALSAINRAILESQL